MYFNLFIQVKLAKAPSLGLYLNKINFEYYNKKYKDDPLHPEIEWSDYEVLYFIFSLLLMTFMKMRFGGIFWIKNLKQWRQKNGLFIDFILKKMEALKMKNNRFDFDF